VSKTVPSLPLLQQRLDRALDERLVFDDPAPLIMAFSGGGDSLALLLGAKAWADRRGRRIVAATIDHRLRPQGADWAIWCRQRAQGLGVDHEILAWGGDKPRAGLAAAARGARHALLAEAARRRGAAVILMGHTADDGTEAAAMRAAGATTPTPRAWAPSPVWPQGRGIFVFRPLLSVGRSDLRAALTALEETWIEDPSNRDPTSLRARVRAALAAPALTSMDSGAPAFAVAAGEVVAHEGAAADLNLPLPALLAGPDPAATLGAALLCAAGTDRPPRRAAVERLLAHAVEEVAGAATLAGARIAREGNCLHLARDAGDRRRGAHEDTPLARGKVSVWDGRFEVVAHEAGARIGLLPGRAASLPSGVRAAVLGLPLGARRALPVVTYADGALECPSLLASRRIRVTSLALPRLLATRGGILDEAALRRMAKGPDPS
jgi:tRNA(Ile)-lysidine synthase